MYLGQVGERRVGTRRLENGSTERHSRAMMCAVCPEEKGQTCYQNSSIHTVEPVACAMMSPTLATGPMDITKP